MITGESLDLGVTHASTVQRGEHQIQMSEVPGSMPTVAELFLFSHSKACDANIANFGYFVKNSSM